MISALILCALSQAANLDNVEVGGVWGTPATTDATAVWWNPAGLAHDSGTRFQLQGAPTFAGLNFSRSDPEFGREPSVSYKRVGVLPSAFFATDGGVKGLGLGAGMALPFVRGATEDAPPGEIGNTVARYSLQGANVQAMHLMAGAAYAPSPKISFGGTYHFVLSEWAAQTDSETLSGLNSRLTEAGQTTSYTNDDFYDPDYSTRVYFGGHDQAPDAECGYGKDCDLTGGLTDTAMTFSAGLRVAPTDKVAISANYTHGYRVENSGDAHMSFQCPPDTDAVGRLGAQDAEVCDAQLQVDATVGYNLPARVNFGVQIQPKDDLYLEFMGAYVGWGVFSDYEITISGVTAKNPQLNNPENAASAVERTRLQARDAQNTFWAGVDYKQEFKKKFLVGGRLIYDNGSIPQASMLPSNFDTAHVLLSGVFAYRFQGLQIGVSATQFVAPSTTTTSSNYGLDLQNPKADRYFYPEQNGTYSQFLTRGHVFLRGHYGGSGWRGKDAVFDDGPDITIGAPDQIKAEPAAYTEVRFKLAESGTVGCGSDPESVDGETALYINADNLPADCTITVGEQSTTVVVSAASSFTCEDAGDGLTCMADGASPPPEPRPAVEPPAVEPPAVEPPAVEPAVVAEPMTVEFTVTPEGTVTCGALKQAAAPTAKMFLDAPTECVVVTTSSSWAGTVSQAGAVTCDASAGKVQCTGEPIAASQE